MQEQETHEHKFITPSEIHEQLYVGYLWRTPSLYQKYRSHTIERDTFTKDIWFYYYWLGKEMYDHGVRTFDDVTVYSFVNSRYEKEHSKGIGHYYHEFGGYETIRLLQSECDIDKENDEYHFTEVQKYWTLRKFSKDGLINTHNPHLIDKLVKMNLSQLKMFFQFKNKEAFMHINSGEVKEHNLLDHIDETIELMDRGETVGMPFFETPRLNNKVKGWKEGTLIYLVMSSGMGKTSFGMHTGIMSLLRSNEKGIIFANEEGVLKWRTLLIATVASSILNKPIPRSKLAKGNFDEETKSKLLEARDWLRKHRSDMIKFVGLTKYRIDDVTSRIELYRPLGYKYVFFDTFKPEVGNGDHARWEAFSNSAQTLYDVIKPDANNCATLATVQLKIGKEYRTLDLSSIGKSLEIVEVAGVVLMGRLIFSDEYEGGSNAIYAYNWDEEKFKTSGEWRKRKYDLNIEKMYMLLFIAKNREGEAETGIVYEVNYTFNTWKEVAYFDVMRMSKV
ncbi:DnaB-like helicase C-terminal domain-containing protein [Thermoactinomyces sp. DSM 45892]|uniref:DnaB-like helicase C-terminal domain-containing protein n=1 Tax=Thermoactinomyces sp. DSM 45892 TaxID=1882753 RepID=UPI00089652B8|nr:DnaB-like helicase C-terminal domain-containing protein [Thermoactinomyces sp. DSM 45892]SDX93817.1 DnaB-like helicase C terminal domain-containing protein [Thermoactinomyces sp. DSM 45892]